MSRQGQNSMEGSKSCCSGSRKEAALSDNQPANLSFGVNGTALAWLTSYLTNRSQTVRIGDISSTPSICISGVPQGSDLGPVLFSLYISPSVKLFRILVFHINNMLMMRNSTSASKVVVSVLQLTALKHAYFFSLFMAMLQCSRSQS